MYHLVYDEDILRDESKCDHCGGGVVRGQCPCHLNGCHCIVIEVLPDYLPINSVTDCLHCYILLPRIS